MAGTGGKVPGVRCPRSSMDRTRVSILTLSDFNLTGEKTKWDAGKQGWTFLLLFLLFSVAHYGLALETPELTLLDGLLHR
jgi:hypothetical protein